MFDPCFDRWQHLRWENLKSRRYYEAWVRKNLMGDWEVFCAWGGIGTKLGSSKAIPVTSLNEADIVIANLHTKRLKRHYLPVSHD